MITGVIKNKVDKIWTDIWAGGITNPITVIEQLTYLMFIRSLDEKEFEREEFANMTGEETDHIFPQTETGQSMRWSRFKNMDSRKIFDLISMFVFPAVKKMKYGRLPDFNSKGELIEISDEQNGCCPQNSEQPQTAFTRYMDNAVFVIPNPQVLQKVITGLDDLYEHDIADLDMQGDLYEYMLGKLSTAGQNGQFRTPKHIREMMVELVAPAPDDLICDPACGTAGFLVSAAEYIRKHYDGIPAYVDTDVEFCLYVSVCFIKPKHDLINSKFLVVQMDMPFIKHQVDRRIKGIGVPDLHLNQISDFEIMCPLRQMQKTFCIVRGID